ncbi:sensor histidine kinase [Pseudooceanicola sp. 502str34]
MFRSPVQTMLAMVALACAITAVVVGLALREPYLGVDLRAGAAAASGEGVTVAHVTAGGPAAQAGLVAGDVLVALSPVSGGSGAGLRLPLRPVDLIEEPDALPTVTAMRGFFAEQGARHGLLSAGPVALEVRRGGESLRLVAEPAGHRPVGDLPWVFWTQLFVGFAAVVLGGWALSLRGSEPGVVCLALAGVALSLSASAAALYSTRELALPEALFARASAVNTLGSIGFGIAMICLFLLFPRRYLPRWVVGAVIAVFGTWMVLAVTRALEPVAMIIHIPVLVEMICILLAAGGQVWATRGDPHSRAALRWFGLSVLLGAGGFVGMVALPQALGLAPQMSQGHAFLLFLLIYVGLALGVARYRLFELERWAYDILFYAGGVAILLLLDAALIWAVALDQLPAFSLALMAVAFLYLPMRERLGRMLSSTPQLRTEELFDRIGAVILSPGGQSQSERMRQLLTDLFHPLHIAEAPGPVPVARLLDGGAVLEVPGVDQAPPLRLHWARRGKRLFSPRDVDRVRQILQMMTQAVERLRAYDAGAEEERRRINRDMHDNIGVQLLGALHSADPQRKDALIRQTLTDLREIVSSPAGEPVLLDDLLGDMRAEIADHLGAAGIALSWEAAPAPAQEVAPHVANSIRAILREAAGNVLRHADATAVTVRIGLALTGEGVLDRVILEVTDDGRGPARARAEAEGPGPGQTSGQTSEPALRRGSGNGLRNLRGRTEARGGQFAFGAGPGGQGARLRAVLLNEAVAPLREGLRDAGE